MWQGAKQAAQLVLRTRAKKTPELDENEWTSLLEGECKEDEWTSLLEDECKEDVKDLEVAEDLGAFPKGVTVQFHSLSTTEGAKRNGFYGRIIKVYHKAPDKARVYKVMIVMKNDPIRPVKVRQTNIKLVDFPL